MQRFVFSPPSAWKTDAPGQYSSGPAAIRVGELAPLPEDLTLFVDAEMRKVAGGAAVALVELQRIPLASAWPAFGAEMGFGDKRRLVLAVQLVDRGVLVWLDAPESAFAAARTELVAALGAARLDWGPPEFLSLAEILDGVPR